MRIRDSNEYKYMIEFRNGYFRFVCVGWFQGIVLFE